MRRPDWYLISLRARDNHAALRRAASRAGAGALALSPWRIEARADAETRAALAAALAAPCVFFTSPAAVRAAAALRPLRLLPGQAWLAVGAGTALALRRAGVGEVQSPARMDSEGALALPALAQADEVGLVTAPGGRGLIAAALAARGARVVRAEVYARVPTALSPQALGRLRALDRPACVALSSGEALRQVLARLPDDLAGRLRAQAVAAASERLEALARELGFATVVRAAGPRPRQLVDAAAAAMARRASGAARST